MHSYNHGGAGSDHRPTSNAQEGRADLRRLYLARHSAKIIGFSNRVREVDLEQRSDDAWGDTYAHTLLLWFFLR
jgi:hypothetical protein